MITCYLDSQDFSTLTDPKLDSSERRSIRDALLYFSRSCAVKFAFSAPTVCESVALAPDTAHLAELKAEFISDLCGSNALISFDRLVEAEIVRLANRSSKLTEIFDPYGRWFPEIPVNGLEPNIWMMVRDIAEEELSASGLSRQQRRAAARKLVKNGKPRAQFRAHLAQQDARSYATEIIERYPMRPEYAEIMGRYGLGRASEHEFTEALTNSLKDPRWMMKWFTTQHSISSPIAEIVRKPGREIGEMMRQLVNTSQGLVLSPIEDDSEGAPTWKNLKSAEYWVQAQDKQLVDLVKRIVNTMAGLSVNNFSASEVDKYCPGLSACFRSLHSSLWENVGGSRKEMPSDSQPVDSIHALYAPYMKIFRADRFMAPHIQKHVKSYGTTVVPRLTQLVDTLQKQLRQAS